MYLGGTLIGMPTTVGERIKEAREALKVSPAEFAREIGIKQPTLWDLENGETKNPAAETLQRMHERYGINRDYIMRGRGPKILESIERKLENETLLSMLEEMEHSDREALLAMAKALHRKRGKPGPNDPFQTDPPKDSQ